MLSLRFSLLPNSSTPPTNNKNQHILSPNYTTTCSSINDAKFPKVSATASTTSSAPGTTSTPAAVAEEGLGLSLGLKRELVPKHVAVIMDGHGRWAAEHGVPIQHGHRAGSEKVKLLLRLCGQWGVKVLTLFAFSTENWVRPKDEVNYLMKLFLEQASSQENVRELLREGVRVTFIGDKSQLSSSLRQTLNFVEGVTKANTRLHLMIALNYSGHYDILQATKSIASKVRNGLIEVEDIDKSLFEQQLETSCSEYPNPDLFIRTSGEERVSNFLLWQLAYTELYFTKKTFPDMEEEDFLKAFASFQQRQRRFGGRV